AGGDRPLYRAGEQPAVPRLPDGQVPDGDGRAAVPAVAAQPQRHRQRAHLRTRGREDVSRLELTGKAPPTRSVSEGAVAPSLTLRVGVPAPRRSTVPSAPPLPPPARSAAPAGFRS